MPNMPSPALDNKVCRHTSVIPAFRRQRQEDSEFTVILSYIANWMPNWDNRNVVSKKKKNYKP